MPRSPSSAKVPMLPPCPVHGHPGHLRRPMDALPPGRCAEGALLAALASYRRTEHPVLNPAQPWRKGWARPAEVVRREENRAAQMARAVWLNYCADPLPSWSDAAEQMSVPDGAAVRQLAREGVRQLRAVLGPWSEASQALLGADTRSSWAVCGCSSSTA